IHPSSHQERDRDVAMSDAHVSPEVRYTPYAIPSYYWRGSCHRGDQTHGNMERDRKPPQEGMEEDWQDGSSRSWFKVTFPSGIKYDEKCMQNLIKSLCSVPLNLTEVREGREAAEWAQGRWRGQEFLEFTHILLSSLQPSISARPSAVPYCKQKELKSQKAKLIKVTKNKGYEVPQQAHDLQRVHSDPDARIHCIEKGPNFRNCMAASLQIHEENSPKLLSFNSSNNTPHQLVGLRDTTQKAPNIRSLNLSKNEVMSEGELDEVKGLEPEEMCAGRNTPCTTFPDKATNISSILELFPKLLRLDNHEVPPPVVFGTEASKKLPVCKGSIFGSETLKNLILEFLQQYYCIYDYEDRRGLQDAYHNEACFSLAIPFNPEDLVPSWFDKYSKGSRNIKKLKDPVLCVHLLKHTKRDIVDFLSELPRTQHDISSLVVDMCVQTEKMLCFSVSGAFKEVEGLFQAHVRAFTRIFIATPSSNSSLRIVNDQLCVGDGSPIETQGSFPTPVPTPSSSPVPTFSEKQQMVQASSTQSGMNLEWPQKCLHDNNWDYTRASQMFTLSTPVLKIPEDTFMK
uniref:NTF2 domain-containing protein n=1 Tax=Loxodonta africana TaxID=9785 RepID=G3TEP3_LOXAF